MADKNNNASNLSHEDRVKGGQNSSGSFQKGSQRASEAGKKGAQNQPIEAKKKGGENSHRGSSNS